MADFVADYPLELIPVQSFHQPLRDGNRCVRGVSPCGKRVGIRVGDEVNLWPWETCRNGHFVDHIEERTVSGIIVRHRRCGCRCEDRLVAVCGTAYVQLGAVPCLAVWAAVPVGALATAIIVVNNLRDRATDVRVGKRTLAVRLGRTGALVEYALLLATSYAVSIGLAVTSHDGWVLLPLASLPLAISRMRALVRAAGGPEFNACLAATGQLLLAYGVLFSVGLSL